jgi:hypothetical protein
MRQPRLDRRRALCMLTVAILIGALVPSVAAQNPLKWMGFGDKNTKYQPYRDPGGRFDLEYPAKDWKLLPSGSSSSTLAIFQRGDEATLFVEHVTMLSALTPAEIAAMAAVELDAVKDRQPKATGFKTEPFDSRSGNGVLISYARVGSGPETAVQYSVAVGLELFRINGVVQTRQWAKYEPIVKYMIQSFRAPAAGASKN